MRITRTLSIAGLLLLPGAAPPLAVPQVLAARVADYVDEGDGGRVHAEIGAELRRAAGGQRLWLRLSATGSRVDPVPGFEGVRGANRITARELGQLLDAGELRLRTRRRGTAAAVDGDFRVTRRGRVPIRATAADGGVDLHAETTQEFVLEVVADSGALGDGEFVAEVLARGVPRLRVCFTLGAQPALTTIEALDGEDVRS